MDETFGNSDLMSLQLDSSVDEEHETKERILLRYFVQEWATVKSIIDRIVISDGVTNPSDVNRIRSIIDKYQQEGQLLEPYLESIVSTLMSLVHSKALHLKDATNEALDIIKPICIIIYSMVTVCGHKAVIRYFPHKVSDFEIAVVLLEKCHSGNSLTYLRQESTGEMETKCVALLWLYILVLIPFDISSVDSSIASSNQLRGFEPPPLVLKIVEILKDHLSSSGPMRRFAGLVLSRLLTRPDMTLVFKRFFEWTVEFSQSSTEVDVNQFRLLGIVEALASIFKVGGRKILLEAVDKTWANVSQLMKSDVAAQNTLLRKYIAKLAQRIGLICLPHPSTQWRYMVMTSSLGQNILNPFEGSSVGSAGQLSDHSIDIQNTEILGEDEIDVPEIVEEILELLLSGLRDSDTVVRWSAAKGIGRITACLTSSLAEEVLSSILELFSPGEGDGSCHGGCLALAEFARRGLLLPVSFPKVVPFIIKALHFDLRRGPHSIGSHVRDAAAYVCWAFGRAYNYSDMKGVLEQLAPHLLSLACYDREVNCRRAASAAFQENIGRQGNFPHGIEIVSSADYFSVASRTNSYLDVAPTIAQYKEYLRPFSEELLSSKVSHWDTSLRELAAQAISCLAKYDPDYFAGAVLERLIPLTLSVDLCTRHGSTLAVGELVLALHECGFCFSMEKQQKIASIVPAIEKARLYRGKGGEIMRSAVSRFINLISCSAISLGAKTRKIYFDTLTDNLKHPNAQIQCAAVDALRRFIQAYFAYPDEEVSNETISKYLEFLDDPNVAARRGAASALGILPYEFLSIRWREILRQLCKACLLKNKSDDPDAEARVNAVKGLVSVCETLTETSNNQNLDDNSIHLFIKNDVIKTLFDALDDYAVDNRGDVGSWVRDAAMDALERCTYILCKYDSEHSINGQRDLNRSSLPSDQICLFFDENLAINLIKGIAKQAVEKIDKIRGIAGKILQRILHYPLHFVPHIPHREALKTIIPSDTNFKWEDPTVSYRKLVCLLQFSCYCRSVLSGYVVSVGGLQEFLSKASKDALIEFIEKSEDDKTQNNREFMLSTDLLWILKNYQKCNRIIMPTLKTIEILFSRKVFFDMKGHTVDFCTALLESMEVELKGTKDFLKLYTGISVLGYIATLAEPISYCALANLLRFLGHQYPKIRKAAADQVYLVILQNPSSLVAGGEDKMERVLEILAETIWDGSIEEAKQSRLRLLDSAGFVAAGISSAVVRPEVYEWRPERDVNDENRSYSSLVDYAGF